MSIFSRTRLESLEPEQITLTVQGKARLRVQGRVCGFVACGQERRWACGPFDETFQISRAGRGAGEIVVRAWGVGGMVRRTVRFTGSLDLTVSTPQTMLGRVRWGSYRVPSVRGVRVVEDA